MITQAERWQKTLNEYRGVLDDMTLRELVLEFFARLDYTEESDNGRIFHPTTIGSCRLLEGNKMNILLEIMKKKC